MEGVLKKSDRLSGRKIALCVSGSIAAVESVKIARELRRYGAEVFGYMTESACSIIHPDTIEFATGNTPVTELTGKLEHLRSFDLILAAPATANTVSKVSHGIADNPVTTLILSTACKVVVAPAMHDEMYRNPLVLESLEKLGGRFVVAGPVFDEGSAKMAPLDLILDMTLYALSGKDLKNKKLVVTAGPTAEPVDPVRVISNRSSGKMGMAIAREGFYRGADVTLIVGPGCEKPPAVVKTVRVETAAQMAEAVADEKDYDIFVGAAAVSDFTLKPSGRKIDSKDGDLTLRLTPTKKILSHIRQKALKVGFKAVHLEDEKDLIASGKKLMKEHSLDIVVANDVSKGIFGSDDAEVYLITGDNVSKVERTSKAEIAGKVFDLLMNL